MSELMTREQIEEWRQWLLADCDKEHHAQADALCDLALASLDREWQPISTAPKDGTAILVWIGDCMTTAQFSYDAWNLLEWGSYADDALCYPTHWMPLPPPPGED